MTFDSSAPGIPDHFDTGPLSWIMEELRQTLGRAVELLHGNADGGSVAAWGDAAGFLHQAHGALQIVDVPGVPLLTEAAEELTKRVADGALLPDAGLAAAIVAACEALVEYLEELLASARQQPLLLYPYYHALQAARGIARIHPAELYFPNLAVLPQLPPPPAGFAPVDAAGLRQRFEKALLGFLKHADAAAERDAATALAEVLEAQSHGAASAEQRALWWVLQGFASAAACGAIAATVDVKQLFGRINLLMRKPGDTPPETRDRLMRDALFFIACVEQPAPLLQRIRQVYGLSPVHAADLDKPRFGHADAAAMAVARGHLANAKSSWDKLAGGEAGAAAAFGRQIAELATVAEPLKGGVLRGLLDELGAVARQVQQTPPGDRLALETAAGLLFIENALRRSRVDDEFGARVDTMASRLHALAAGAEPEAAADWLDGMSEREQQRESLAALVGEIRTNLAHVEKMLDEFFSNCAKRTVLAPVDGILHQVEGALAVLELDDAASAVCYVRSQVAAFASPDFEGEPGRPEFQQVARNLGALSLFIEGLQTDSANAGTRFVFDPVSGLFHVRTDAAAPVEVVVAPWTDADGAELAAEPAATDEAAVTAPVELPEAAAPFAAEPAFAAPAPVSPPAAAQADAMATSARQPEEADDVEDAIDAELLDIFLSEAVELLESIEQTLPLLSAHPHDQEYLTTTRRCFHTLKGSSRMVGLNEFGEAAWGLEKTLNLFLADSAAASPDLLRLVQRAHDELGAWIRELREQGVSRRSAAALTAAAERVRAGEPLDVEEATSAVSEHAAEDAAEEVAVDAQAAAPEAATPPVPEVLPEEPASPETAIHLDAPMLPETLDLAEAPELPENPAPQEAPEAFDLSEASDFAEAQPVLPADAPMPALSDEAVFGEALADAGKPEDTLEAGMLPPEGIELEALSLDDFEALLAGNAEEAADIAAHEPPDQIEASAAEELPVAEALVEAPAADIAPPPAEPPRARVIEFPEVHPLEAKLDDSIKRIGDIEISVPLHNIYLAETDELLRLLSQDLSEWRHEAGRNVNTTTVHAAHSLTGSSATVGFMPLHELAYALEKLLQAVARKPTPLLPAEFDELDTVLERLKAMLQAFALGDMPAPDPDGVRLLERIRQDLASRADAGIGERHTAAPVYAAHPDAASAGQADAPLLAQHRPIVEFAADTDKPQALMPAAGLARMPRDELDPDLLPVFLEEASDILPQIQSALRAWQAHPAQTENAHALMRLLHTIKGSARMAGAMRFGQHMHEMESRIEHLTLAGTPSAEAIDELLGRFDLGLQIHDSLRDPGEAQPAPAAQPPAQAATAATPAVPAQPAAQPTAPLVRVRADILDRLVNQAGEVSISRSRIESEVAGMQQSLSELTENVERLRAQLREVEIQAESQMASQMAQSAARGFDPLEFDRFTRLQELTRMMAETVSDVVSVQQSLARGIEGAGGNLQQQARLTRDLQQDLMRVRMVQFASIAERLYRVTRQAAKESDKRVNLDIHGSTVEVDRGVLEKMAGPFEHLLRNAVVHGIEARTERRTSGKPEVGELLIDIRQEGNEVVIRFSDDGRGLDAARILQRARQAGLVAEGATLDDAEVRELIFQPGFSTAAEVTELAGRGVGMDVVRSEAAALGGRVDIETEAGRGSSFIVRLPLTLAVTQVVVLSTGGKTYAMPSVLVEQVQQLKSAALAAAYADGAIPWQGQRVPLYYLSELLGNDHAAPMNQQYSPVLILRRGEERVAVHVDEVIGNREVVVKNIGPQLARMAGIAGATVLGSGEIVLIIDPLPLAQRLAQGQRRASAAELATQDAAQPADTAPRSQPLVMVVDDSITVRRVTQRFLAREGYQVVLAKDGVDALEQLQTVTPDAMLVDIEMPRMDGFDLTRNVRSDARTRHIPIVMITSRTAPKHRNLAMELGVNEYLGKPYRDEELLRLLSGFVRRESPVA